MNIIVYKVTIRSVFGAWVNSPLPGTRSEVIERITAQYAAMGLEVIDVRLQYSEGEPTVLIEEPPVTATPNDLAPEFPYRKAKFRPIRAEL